MPGYVWKRCKRCHKGRTASRHISARGLCPGCAETAYIANARALATKSGPEYEHWRAAWIDGVLASVEAHEAEPGA